MSLIFHGTRSWFGTDYNENNMDANVDSNDCVYAKHGIDKSDGYEGWYRVILSVA